MTGAVCAPFPHRQFFLDWLRIAALLILIFFHVGMYYGGWNYHVKSPHATPALDPWMMLSEPWRMSLLFFISGAALSCAWHHAQRSTSFDCNRFLRRRSRQLLLPLLCGIVLIVPPQSYFEVQQKFNYSGDFWDFLRLYYTHSRAFCDGQSCLVMPTWNHLWFLPYLALYSVLAVLLCHFFPKPIHRFKTWLQTRQSGGMKSHAWLLWPIVWLALLRIGLAKQFPTTHDFVHDFFNHARYFTVFWLGFILAQIPDAWSRLAHLRRTALVLACAAWATFLLTYQQVPIFLSHALLACMQWSAVCAALGYGWVHLQLDSIWRQRLSEAVFPVYLFHQTVLIVLSQYLLPLAMPPIAEAAILIIGTLSISYLLYVLVRQVSWLRPWFGCRASDQAAS